jgi:hypothetical protein
MKKMILLVSLLTLVAFVSLAVAQQKPAPAPAAPAATAPAPEKAKVEKKAKMETVTGPIENVDEAGKAIVVKGKTVGVDDKTKITKAGKAVQFADLKKDMQVSAQFKKDGDKLIAATIKLVAPKAAPKKAEPKAEPAEKKAPPAEAPKK